MKQNRKNTPDIMANLMTATIQPESNKEVKQGANKAIELANNNAVKQQSNKAIKPESHKEIKEQPKDKATFNLSTGLLEQLDECWLQLRRQLKENRITKTSIVEAALELAMSEFCHKGKLAPSTKNYQINKYYLELPEKGFSGSSSLII